MLISDLSNFGSPSLDEQPGVSFHGIAANYMEGVNSIPDGAACGQLRSCWYSISARDSQRFAWAGRVKLMAQVCRKQYNSAAELEIHLDSYDHHHRKVLLSTVSFLTSPFKRCSMFSVLTVCYSHSSTGTGWTKFIGAANHCAPFSVLDGSFHHKAALTGCCCDPETCGDEVRRQRTHKTGSGQTREETPG